MPTTPTAVRTHGSPAGTLLLPALLLVLLAGLLAGCGQASTGAGGPAAPPAASTGPTSPTAGDGMDTTPDPSTPPSGVPSEGLTPVPPGASSGTSVLPADPSGADLVLVAGPPGAQQPPVTLACDWAGGTSGGTHPQAAQACADLLAAVRAGDPFAPVAPDAMCTQQYGGDAVVEVTGTVLGADGSPVDVAGTFTLTDGCQIGRFDAMGAVLAPFRGSV